MVVGVTVSDTADGEGGGGIGVGIVCLLQTPCHVHCGWGMGVWNGGLGGLGGVYVVSYIANHSLLIVCQVLAKLGPGGVVPDQVGVLCVAVEDLEQLHRPSPTRGN